MSRLVVITVAAAATVLVVRREPRLAARLRTGVSDIADSVAAFASEVRENMAVREHELRRAAGLPIRPAA